MQLQQLNQLCRKVTPVFLRRVCKQASMLYLVPCLATWYPAWLQTHLQGYLQCFILHSLCQQCQKVLAQLCDCCIFPVSYQQLHHASSVTSGSIMTNRSGSKACANLCTGAQTCPVIEHREKHEAANVGEHHQD
jgi:hypothetical protein